MLWAQVLKAKYFPRTNLFESGINPRASHIWKAFQVGIKWLKQGMNQILGDSQTIPVWENHLLPDSPLRNCIHGPLLPNEEQRLVSSLWDNNTWRL